MLVVLWNRGTGKYFICVRVWISGAIYLANVPLLLIICNRTSMVIVGLKNMFCINLMVKLRSNLDDLTDDLEVLTAIELVCHVPRYMKAVTLVIVNIWNNSHSLRCVFLFHLCLPNYSPTLNIQISTLLQFRLNCWMSTRVGNVHGSIPICQCGWMAAGVCFERPAESNVKPEQKSCAKEKR